MTVVADATVDAQPVAADPGFQPADGREWFARHVSADPLRLVIELDPRSDIVVLDHDETTGSFRASLGHVGALARRPRSAEPWDLGWPNVRYRWSTTRWDWALYFYGAAPTARSVEALIEHLGDGV